MWQEKEELERGGKSKGWVRGLARASALKKTRKKKLKIRRKEKTFLGERGGKCAGRNRERKLNRGYARTAQLKKK